MYRYVGRHIDTTVYTWQPWLSKRVIERPIGEFHALKKKP
jgi:hypothetical protein